MIKSPLSAIIPFLGYGAIAVVFVFIIHPSALIKRISPAAIVEALPTDTTELCENYKDITEFSQPQPIVWTARLDDCLVGCQGAAFTRIPADEAYPRFAGYYPEDLGTIPEQFLKAGLLLKITGQWTGISDDHARTVFGNRCVPTVDIQTIEVVNR